MAKNKTNVLAIQDYECMGLKLNNPINPTKLTPSLTIEVVDHIELNKLLPLQADNMSKDHIVTISTYVGQATECKEFHTRGTLQYRRQGE
jgi:hypothetical protein